MKKLSMVLLAAALCLTLFACGSGPSPSDVVSTYLDAVKAQDSEAIAGVYAGEASDVAFNSIGEDENAFSKELQDNMMSKFLAFDYTVGNEKAEDDKATVDVTVTAYNMGDIFQDAVGEYMNRALPLIFSDVTDEDMNALLEEVMTEKLEGAEKNYEKTVTVSLTKTDKGWVIDEFEDITGLPDALTGGMASYAESMSRVFGGDDSADDGTGDGADDNEGADGAE